MKLVQLIDKLCYPTSERLRQNKAQQNLIFHGNKAYCIAVFACLAVLILASLFLLKLPKFPMRVALALVGSNFLVLLLTCRKYPHVFPCYHILSANLFSPLVYKSAGGCFWAYAGCFTSL
jgi:hypothetical protein